MLSRGRIDVDNVYSLSDGILRLSLRRDTYEKAGLVGQPSRFGNTSGKKQPTRYSTLIPAQRTDPLFLMSAYTPQLSKSTSATPPCCTAKRGLSVSCGASPTS